MTKSEIVREVAKSSKLDVRTTNELLQAFLSVVGETIRSGERITISGFGTFSGSERAEREGVHPHDSSQRIVIPSLVVPSFRASDQLKEKIR
jgi:DNA-binding protein HU-beta